MWFFRKKKKTKNTDPDILAHGHFVSPYSNIISMKVLGAGCRKCISLKLNTETALKELNINMDVEFIKDTKKIKQYNTEPPALVINEEVVSSGKILTTAEIKSLLYNIFHT